jgi:hypothetical protein
VQPGRHCLAFIDRIVFRSSAKLSTVNSQLSTDLQMLSIPTFPESHHKILQSLANYSDRELIHRHQLHPEQGKFFAAIFYRYGEVIYQIASNQMESQIQADYLFAAVWFEIFTELSQVCLATDPATNNWHDWLVDIASGKIDLVLVPPATQIRYQLAAAPPPLWCYLERGLDRLSPLVRLIVVMNQNFHWNEQRISAYLQGEGQQVSAASVADYLAVGCRELETELPQDIRDIYLVGRIENLLIAS